MSRSAGAHLTNDEIQEFLSFGEATRESLAADQQELERHLAGCEQCRNLLELHRVQQNRLGLLRAHTNVPPGPRCPEETVWVKLAAGFLDSGLAGELSEHAAECDYCGPQLHHAISDLTREISDSERALFSMLPATTPDWQKEMAAKMEAGARPQLRQEAPRRPWLVFTWAAAGCAALAIVVVLWWYHDQSSRVPSDLLAQAYTAQRTIELRIFESPHSALQVRRGSEANSTFDRPPALIEADARIVRGLQQHPQDAAWIQAEGRSDLLAWNFEAAMRSFKQALQLQPNSPELLTDYATAYFERGEVTGRDMDYGKAFDLLSQALSQRPDLPLALFNRAIVSERLRMYPQAIEDLERYLQHDSNSGWAGEARDKLAEIQKKIRERSSLSLPRQLEEFLALAVSPSDSIPEEIASHSEEMLETALISWLPHLYDSSPSRRQADQNALERLAAIEIRYHGDAWLQDLLTSERREGTLQGLAGLSQSVQANVEGNPQSSLKAARRAETSFRRTGNQPGMIRAQLEEIYSFQRQADSGRCMSRAAAVSRALAGKSYPWARAQLALELSICSTMRGNFVAARRHVDLSIQIARQSGMGVLELRAIGIRAALFTTMGNSISAWSENRAGLIRYWEGSYPEQRAFQFYSDLSFVAEKEGHWHLAAALARDAAQAISRTSNRSAAAMAWHRYGALAQSAGFSNSALEAFHRATIIFDSLPQNDTTKIYRLDCEIHLSALEASRGYVDNPLQRLHAVRSQVENISNLTIRQRFYKTLGILQLQSGDLQAAEATFSSAIAGSELAFRSLKSDNERLAWKQETSEIYRGLIELLFRRGEHAAALRLWRQGRIFSLNGRMVEARPRPLLPGEIVLSYAQLPDGIALWITDANNVEAHWIDASGPIIQSLVEKFLEECSDPNSSILLLKQDGYQLYRLLIEPIADRLAPEQCLLLEMDGWLARVAFPALSDRNGRYLGQGHSIVTSIGQRNLPAVWQHWTINRRQHALIVGAPTLLPELSSAFPPLSDAQSEAQFISELFDKPTLLVKNSATLAAVQRKLKQAEIFHFAGHALFTSGGGGLLLADQDSNYILDGTHLDLIWPKLVVLSACSTGTGEPGTINPEGMVRAFLSSGASQVVAARWSVDSVVTGKFMETFYQAMFQKKPSFLALQEAAADVMNHPPTAHPYYWASFNLYVAD